MRKPAKTSPRSATKKLRNCGCTRRRGVAKLAPFLPELRRLSGDERYLANLEALVRSRGDAEQRLSGMRKYMRHKQAQLASDATG